MLLQGRDTSSPVLWLTKAVAFAKFDCEAKDDVIPQELTSDMGISDASKLVFACTHVLARAGQCHKSCSSCIASV